MSVNIFIQILLIICILSVVWMGLICWFAYDQQLRRHEVFEQEQEKQKKVILFYFKGLPFLSGKVDMMKDWNPIIPHT